MEASFSEPRAKRPAAWLEVLLVLAVLFVFGGTPAPQVNETHYLAKAKHYWNPAWCAGDLFLESADAHLVFYWTVGWPTKFCSLATVAWLGRLAAWTVIALGWVRLLRRTTRLPWAAPLAALVWLVLIAHCDFAGEWVVGGVEGKCFAYGFIFWAMADLIVGDWKNVWPWLGVSSAFHPVVGGWAVVAAAIVWATVDRRNTSLRSMLPSLLLGGALSLPGLAPALALDWGVDAAVREEASRIYVFQRLPHHLAPLSLSAAELTRRAVRFGILVAGFAALVLSERKSQAAFYRAEDTQSRQRWRLVCFAQSCLVLWILGLLWEFDAGIHPALAASLLKYYWFRLADVMVPLATTVLLVWWFERLQQRSSKRAAALLVATLALCTWHVGGMLHERIDRPTHAGEGRLPDPAQWEEACLWIRENTPADANFLIPRLGQSFKWFAQRADVANWKDVPQDATSIVAWWNRCRDIYWPPPNEEEDNFYENTKSYRSLASQGTGRIRTLAERYGADYVLTLAYPPLAMPVVHSNATYTVYRVE